MKLSRVPVNHLLTGLPGLSTEGSGDPLWRDWIQPKGPEEYRANASMKATSPHVQSIFALFVHAWMSSPITCFQFPLTLKHSQIFQTRHPFKKLRGSVLKLIVGLLSKKHATSQQFITSLPRFLGRFVPRSLPSGCASSPIRSKDGP